MDSKKSKTSLKASTKAESGVTLHIDGKKFHLGYSRVACAESCMRQYMYSYRDGIRTPGSVAQRRGNAYHATLEWMEKIKMSTGEPVSLERAERAAIRNSKVYDLTDAEIYRVIDAVRFWYSVEYNKPAPVAVEQDFTITRGGIKLTGRIDRIEQGGLVKDYKFSYDKWAESRARYGCQPIIYQWAGLDYIPKLFKGWEYTGFAYQIIRLFPTPLIQDIRIDMIPQWESDWYEEQIAQLAGSIKSGYFPARPSDKQCSWCGHKELCKPPIWNIHTNDTVADIKTIDDFEDC